MLLALKQFLLIYYLCIITNTVLDGCVILSVILFVRYRNHFPVVQFQNQVHIRNPHGTGQVFKTIWDAEGTPIVFHFIDAEGGVSCRPRWGTPSAPFFFSFSFPKVAPLPRRAKEIPPKPGISRVKPNLSCNHTCSINFAPNQSETRSYNSS